MKIGVLTSSRADYGIYLPLLSELKNDHFFQLEIIAFGTHVSKGHGQTVSLIKQDGFKIIHEINNLTDSDSEYGISMSYAKTVAEFAKFWASHKYDLVLCLGDRFEINAAVQAGIPFNLTYVHLHGGETTLGAIDNIYRHQITLASKVHFTSTASHSEKVIALLGSDSHVFNVGALSLDQLSGFKPVPRQELETRFGVPAGPYILCTFHPETVASEAVEMHANQMKTALKSLSDEVSIVVTMPNADTHGSVFRGKLTSLSDQNPERIHLVENFGKQYYFSAMHYAAVLLGNTSSGIIEAASFGKYVVNVGDRQKGRSAGENVLNVPFNAPQIYKKTKEALALGPYTGENIYHRQNVAKHMVEVLKQL